MKVGIDMDQKTILKVAASSLIVALSLAGCSGASLNSSASVASATKEKQASVNARAAERALAAHDALRAIPAAEASVLAESDNASYRALLGRSYLMSGRYASAQTAFEDAMALGNRDPRTVVSLALIRTAQGHAADARTLLTANMDVLPAADYGLAMAMSGDTGEAIRVLGQAIHDPASGAKERQNLAYSYALAGRWTEAKLIAEQDIGPVEASKRVLGWAATAQPGAESERVIAMMGVRPLADDAGQPAALALDLSAPRSGQMAAADAPPAPAPEPVIAPQAQPEQAVASAEMSEPAAPSINFAGPAPVIRAPAAPARHPVVAKRSPAQPVRVATTARSVPARAKPAVRQVALIRPVTPAQGSAWVVQLGAFDSAAIAKDRWSRMTRRSATLGQFPTITSAANVNGRAFYRLAVAGFGNRDGAAALCRTVRLQGGSCFVRLGGPEAAPQKWAMAMPKPVKIAMR